MANRDDGVDDTFGCCGLIWMTMMRMMVLMMMMMLLLLLLNDVHHTPWWFVWSVVNRWFVNACKGVLTWFDIYLLIYLYFFSLLFFFSNDDFVYLFLHLVCSTTIYRIHYVDSRIMITSGTIGYFIYIPEEKKIKKNLSYSNKTIHL